MAAAGLLKVIYSGFQEDRLILPRGQPSIDVFQKTFLRTGRFTTEWYKVNFDSIPSFGKTVKATIPRRGHLITRAFLVTNMPDIRTVQSNAASAATAISSNNYIQGPYFGWTNSIGHALIGQAQVTIGANPIDTLDGRLMEVLDEYHTPLEKIPTVNRMLGRYDTGFTVKSNGFNVTNQKVITPLPFWFSRGDPTAALPIDAIGLDTVQISITYNALASLYVSFISLSIASIPIQNTSFTTKGLYSETNLYNIDDIVTDVSGNSYVCIKQPPLPFQVNTTTPGNLNATLNLDYSTGSILSPQGVAAGNLNLPVGQGTSIPVYGAISQFCLIRTDLGNPPIILSGGNEILISPSSQINYPNLVGYSITGPFIQNGTTIIRATGPTIVPIATGPTNTCIKITLSQELIIPAGYNSNYGNNLQTYTITPPSIPQSVFSNYFIPYIPNTPAASIYIQATQNIQTFNCRGVFSKNNQYNVGDLVLDSSNNMYICNTKNTISYTLSTATNGGSGTAGAIKQFPGYILDTDINIAGSVGTNLIESLGNKILVDTGISTSDPTASSQLLNNALIYSCLVGSNITGQFIYSGTVIKSILAPDNLTIGPYADASISNNYIICLTLSNNLNIVQTYMNTRLVYSYTISVVLYNQPNPLATFFTKYTIATTQAYTSLLNSKFNTNTGAIIPNIQMPSSLDIQSAYILLEYVYLDKPEANRIRLGDISYPIVQHYAMNPYSTNGQTTARIPIRIPNPTREIYFMAQNILTNNINASFIASREIMKGNSIWWPDAQGLGIIPYQQLVPAYSGIESEPIATIALLYEGKLVRYATDAPVFFRSILPSIEQRKTPWHNKYYYHIPFGAQNELHGITNPMGHANMDKLQNVELALSFTPSIGTLGYQTLPSYTVYVWAETYGILRVYGGRAGLLFGY